MKLESIKLSPAANGIIVEESWQTPDSDGSWDYESQSYIFTTLDEAFEKVKELWAKWKV